MKTIFTIDLIQYAKVMHWVRRAGNFEVSGFGKVIRQGGHMHVNKVYLLKQSNTAGSTVLDAAELSRAMFLYKDEPGDFNFWWHSHSRMQVFFSGTDHKTIEELGGNGWLLATVFNAFSEHKSAVFVNQPVPMINEDVEMQVAEIPFGEDYRQQLDAEYTRCVTEEKPKPYKGRKWRHFQPKVDWKEQLREWDEEEANRKLLSGETDVIDLDEEALELFDEMD